MTDPTPNDPGVSYPTLAAWLAGAPTDHPGWLLVRDPAPDVAALAQPLESILAELERAAPVRLPSRRRAFRQDVAGFLNLRAELNVGWQLARSGASFAFGADGQPDYECSLAGGTAWIEVTTKSRDDLSRLHDELEAALRGHSILVTLQVPRHLAISESDRRAMCARVVTAVDTMNGAHGSVGLPEIDGSASLTTPSPFGGPDVMLQVSSDLTEHGEAVERVVLWAIEEKVEQSRRGGWDPDTVLVLDASRLGLSWLRPDSVWAGRLEAMGLPWESLPFVAVAVVFSDLTKVGYHGSCVAQPGLIGTSAAKLALLLQYLDFVNKVGGGL